jgi:uncharacterized protein (TIGR02001 family)
MQRKNPALLCPQSVAPKLHLGPISSCFLVPVPFKVGVRVLSAAHDPNGARRERRQTLRDKHMKSKTIYLSFASCMALLALSLPAMAGDDMGSLSGYVTITSDYRFRGISQNDGEPAPQASLNWTGGDGWYLGTWASKINFNDGPSGAFTSHHNTSVEWDIYGGKHFDLGGTDLNLEAYYYAYPDHEGLPGSATYSYVEGIAALSHTFDQLTLTGTVAISPDYFGGTGTGVWLGGNASYVVNDWVTISGNVGHQWAAQLDNQGYGYPYTHWDLGATVAWNGISLDVRYVDTDISKAECQYFNGPRNNWCGATVIGTLTYNFSIFGVE